MEIMWAAGFYEGEGTCGCNIRARSLKVGIPQHNLEPLERMRRFWGGYIHTPNNGRPSVWQIYGPRAYRLLEAIYPHLSKKRQDQVDIAYSRRWPSGRRPNL